MSTKKSTRTLSKKNVELWRQNPSINPRTGKSIKIDGPTYQQFQDMFARLSVKEEKERVQADMNPENEDAMRVVMRYMNTYRDDNRLPAKLATMSKSYLNEFKSMRIADDVDEKREVVDRAMVRSAIDRLSPSVIQKLNMRYVRVGRVTFTVELVNTMVSAFNDILSKFRDYTRWKKTPRNITLYLEKRLETFPHTYHRNKRWFESNKFELQYHQSRLKQMIYRRLEGSAFPLYKKEMMKRFDLPDEAAVFFSYFLEANFEVLIDNLIVYTVSRTHYSDFVPHDYAIEDRHFF